jgi:hypothetical protein
MNDNVLYHAKLNQREFISTKRQIALIKLAIKHIDCLLKQQDRRPEKFELGQVEALLAVEHVAADCVESFKAGSSASGCDENSPHPARRPVL